jgi:hypothetical protein
LGCAQPKGLKFTLLQVKKPTMQAFFYLQRPYRLKPIVARWVHHDGFWKSFVSQPANFLVKWEEL